MSSTSSALRRSPRLLARSSHNGDSDFSDSDSSSFQQPSSGSSSSSDSSWSLFEAPSSSSSSDDGVPYDIEIHLELHRRLNRSSRVPWHLLAVAVAFVFGLVMSPFALRATPTANIPAAVNNTNANTAPTAQPTKAPLPEYMPADFAWLTSDPMAVFNVSRPVLRTPENIAACRTNVTSASRRLKKTWHPDKARSQRRRGGDMLQPAQLEYITTRLVQMTVWALAECGELPQKPDEEEDVRDDERGSGSAWYDARMRLVHDLRERGDFTKAQNLEDAANMRMRMQEEDDDDMPGPNWESANAQPSGIFSGRVFQRLRGLWEV